MTDYQILRQAAESGNREDINALGRWFEREGREFWNGEYYDADGMEIYPVYKLVDAETEDYEIVGYTTDKGEMFVKDGAKKQGIFWRYRDSREIFSDLAADYNTDNFTAEELEDLCILWEKEDEEDEEDPRKAEYFVDDMN